MLNFNITKLTAPFKLLDPDKRQSFLAVSGQRSD